MSTIIAVNSLPYVPFCFIHLNPSIYVTPVLISNITLRFSFSATVGAHSMKRDSVIIIVSASYDAPLMITGVLTFLLSLVRHEGPSAYLVYILC